ncbi:thioredoxin fold domain-containing protein [Hydrogenophaga palleronii]|uniref:thioredoxin fold domain-containing protein n=1 Tax=Hydrogenophaga palleronii TaxID=65655 RepID=UPI000ACEBDD6|nr:thioredoxin fold domain-containing protein [Hydrogenophaga palleronii]
MNQIAPPPAALPTPTSLRGATQAAAARGEPLVVMTTLTGCPYCAIVRNSYLLPMRRDGLLVAVQLDVMDRTGNVQGFDGQLSTPADLARAWKARFTPTVLFFGPDGRELAERLVGIAVPDFYGEYLEARLREARQALKGDKPR